MLDKSNALCCFVFEFFQVAVLLQARIKGQTCSSDLIAHLANYLKNMRRFNAAKWIDCI
jgi:hypothetical protein